MKDYLKRRRLVANGRFAAPDAAEPETKTMLERFESFFVRGAPHACWEWQSAKNQKGYGVIWKGQGKSVAAHRFSFEIHIGQIGDGLYVLHRCDNPCCVNPNHLFLGTARDNILDASRKGRLWHGVEHHSAKLTQGIVEQARTAWREGQSIRSLAKQFHVDKATMGAALRRETWRSVA